MGKSRDYSFKELALPSGFPIAAGVRVWSRVHLITSGEVRGTPGHAAMCSSGAPRGHGTVSRRAGQCSRRDTRVVGPDRRLPASPSRPKSVLLDQQTEQGLWPSKRGLSLLLTRCLE